MKKTKRIFCALLATLIILPMAFVGANANTPTSTPATPAGTVLYANDFGTDYYFGTKTVEVAEFNDEQLAALGMSKYVGGEVPSKTGNIVGYEDGKLKFTATDSSTYKWSTGIQLASAEALQATISAGDVYTITMEIETLAWGGNWLNGLIFAASQDADTGLANWAYLCRNGYDDYCFLVMGGAEGDKGNQWNAYAGDKFDLNLVRKFQVQIDTSTGTAISYIDGVQDKTITNEQFKTIGGIGLVGGTSSVDVYHNLAVHKGTVNEVAAETATEVYNIHTAVANARGAFAMNDSWGGSNNTSWGAYQTFKNADGSNNNKLYMSVDGTATWTNKWGAVVIDGASVFQKFTDDFTVSFDIQLMNAHKNEVFINQGNATAKIICYDEGNGNQFFFGDYNGGQYAQFDYNLGDTVRFQYSVDVETGYATLYANGKTLAITSNQSWVSGSSEKFRIYVGEGQAVYLDNFVITAGGAADAPATMVGVQETEVVEDTYNVRFLATLGNQFDYTDYKSVGFEIVCPYIEGKEWDVTCTTVYSSVTAGDNVGELTTVTAESCGGKYLMAFTVKNIPVSAGEVTFWVVPYFETDAGVAVGTPYEIVYNAGEFVSSSVYAAGTVYNWD